MSDKVGTNETKPQKLLKEVLMQHQAAAQQVMQDKSIMEALKPNLLGLINHNNGSSDAPSNMTEAANAYSEYLASQLTNNQQQQLATSTALDIFAYCQYLSSMMLFKAMATGETPSPLSPSLNITGDKTPPHSPPISDMPKDYSMKNSGKRRDTHRSSNAVKKEHKKPSEKPLIPKSERPIVPSSASRKFISNERRPRQAYNTKQLEKLEAEFQVRFLH